MSNTARFTITEPADLPPGAAPTFGEGEPFSPVPTSPIVLSALAERHESGQHVTLTSGPFAMADIPATGFLTILASPVPGVVHIDADIRYDRGGTLHYEADVRETWVTRTTNHGRNPQESIVLALADVARLPHQSTVRVHFQA
jgi:hypothetical protein